MRPSSFRAVCLVSALALLVPLSLEAQAFDSGSNGSDGALNLTTPGTVIFDPKTFTPPLDPDGDNVYHFTSITIGTGVTVRLRGPELNMAPVFWLASGPVQIDGTIDLNGDSGQNGPEIVNSGSRSPSVPGAGGFPGGVGDTLSTPAQPGSGPGGGLLAQRGDHSAGGAAHAARGNGDIAGPPAYGNQFLIPLMGGSGGAGAYGSNGGGGGAGGGAILIASSTAVRVNGGIRANGGNGGTSTGNLLTGGGGSGGAIHLLAPTLTGTGTLSTTGGNPTSSFNFGSAGRIRLEGFQINLTGAISPGPVRATPFNRNLAPAPLPSLRVVSVDGVPVATDPTGSFTVPDVTINRGTAATVVVEARNVPLGTIVKLHLFSEGGLDQIVNTAPLAGTAALSTATASVTFPPGFSRGFVRAVWTP